jgi:hypothetical protein
MVSNVSTQIVGSVSRRLNMIRYATFTRNSRSIIPRCLRRREPRSLRKM